MTKAARIEQMNDRYVVVTRRRMLRNHDTIDQFEEVITFLREYFDESEEAEG